MKQSNDERCVVLVAFTGRRGRGRGEGWVGAGGFGSGSISESLVTGARFLVTRTKRARTHPEQFLCANRVLDDWALNERSLDADEFSFRRIWWFHSVARWQLWRHCFVTWIGSFYFCIFEWSQSIALEEMYILCFECRTIGGIVPAANPRKLMAGGAHFRRFRPFCGSTAHRIDLDSKEDQ